MRMITDSSDNVIGGYFACSPYMVHESDKKILFKSEKGEAGGVTGLQGAT